jgi:hypothetical protein
MLKRSVCNDAISKAAMPLGRLEARELFCFKQSQFSEMFNVALEEETERSESMVYVTAMIQNSMNLSFTG